MTQMVKRMIEASMRSRQVSRATADGAYSSRRLYRYLERISIELVIKPRKNVELIEGLHLVGL